VGLHCSASTPKARVCAVEHVCALLLWRACCMALTHSVGVACGAVQGACAPLTAADAKEIESTVTGLRLEKSKAEAAEAAVRAGICMLWALPCTDRWINGERVCVQ
jgi:hypothetical protein